MAEDEEESDDDDDDDDDDDEEGESTEESAKMEVDVKPKQKKPEETPKTAVRICHLHVIRQNIFIWEFWLESTCTCA